MRSSRGAHLLFAVSCLLLFDSEGVTQPMKTYIPEGEEAKRCQIGSTMEILAQTIHNRQDAGNESYTHRLLTGDIDQLLKKLVEEAHESTLAAKDVLASNMDSAEVDHLRYEAADVVYHLLVLLERCGIGLDEFAAELNTRMSASEREPGMVMLAPEHVNRGNHVEK